MKIITICLCSILAVSLYAGTKSEERLAQLKLERETVTKQLIGQRANEIKKDKRLEKIAKEILKLNQELTEYLNAKPEIMKMNQKLLKIDSEIKEISNSKE